MHRKGMVIDMRTVLVTGANKGIGFATAKYFWERGDRVILTGRSEERLKAAVAKLGDRADYAVWDVSDIHAAPRVLNALHERYGDIHVIVNNAGIVSDEDISGSDFLTKTEEAWDETMNINLKGLFFALQAEARYMIDHGIRGHIVNVCSEMSFRPAYNAYTTSKWGALGLTKGVARRLAKDGIILNGVAPGETATEILRQKEGEPHPIPSPRGERAMPVEMAEAIYFLAGSQNIIGAVLLSDGGRSLH